MVDKYAKGVRLPQVLSLGRVAIISKPVQLKNKVMEIFTQALETELIGLIVGCIIGISFVVRNLYLENKRLNKALKRIKK